MLVVMGPVLGVSVPKLYEAAFGPGFLLAGHVHRLHAWGAASSIRSSGRRFPTRSGPSAAADALGMRGRHGAGNGAHHRHAGRDPRGPYDLDRGRRARRARRDPDGDLLRALPLEGLFERVPEHAHVDRMVLFLAATSNVFGAVFARLGTATWITNALLAVPLPAWGTMALLLTLIFLLGWPFEWPAIVLIFLPMLAPVAAGLGYDMVFFGTSCAVVLQTAFLSPPVAMSAYYLKQQSM